MRKQQRWIITSLMWIVGCGIILLNVLAYQQAKAMLTYLPSGNRTQSPESLSFAEKVSVLFSGVSLPKPQNTSTPMSCHLAYSTHTVMNGELALEAWLIPHSNSTRMIIMFPGYSAAKSSLLPEAEVFYRLGYSLFLVDMRGCGGSDGLAISMGYHEANDVAVAFRFIQQRYSEHQIILFGRSMGGVSVLRAVAAHNIQPDGLILESVFDQMLTTVKRRFFAMKLPAFPAAHLLVFWGGIQRGFWGFSHNPAVYAESVKCPVLLLHGENDPRIAMQDAQALFEHFHTAKRLHFFEKLGHEAFYAAEPEQWRQEILQFLQALNNKSRQSASFRVFSY